MTSGADLQRITKDALLGLLARGQAGRTCVVTPNLRLAAALARDFDARQIGSGLTTWEAVDIVPLSAFVERLYEDALYSELVTRLPILLSGAQEQALWEDIVQSSAAGRALLSVAPAAALAREAWQLAHAWRLMPRLRDYPSNDDAKAFADWAWRYEGAMKRDRHCDRARLADVVIPHLRHDALRKPATLVAYGFDIVTPQQREWIAALERTGVAVLACGPEQRHARVHHVAYASAKEEIGAAAQWARSRLEADANARIGIVVPDIVQSRRIVQRVFARVMEPGAALPGAEPRPQPFNISIGEPLSSYPLVAAALGVLDLARSSVAGEIEFSRASRLIRSPFIGGAEAELAQRARLDAELRKSCGERVGLEPLRRAIAKLTAWGRSAGRSVGRKFEAPDAPDCSILTHRLAELSKAAKGHLHGAKRPGEWGKVFSALLDVIGFPGERALDSAEYQTLKKFHEAIAGFATLDRVCARLRAEEALGRLKRITADTLFQPEVPQVSIQVLGVLESAGMEFDYLWVMGLTDEAWPMPARPNPFVPVALQRAAGVPEASAAASFELDARITRGWLLAAGEVVFSHPLREDDREFLPSPLIRDLPEAGTEGLVLSDYPALRDAIHRARREERLPDDKAPPLDAGVTSAGGTGVFKDQAACPFRAYALHRLRAEGLDAPHAGLDAAERGTLVHAMLAHVWQELKSKARLDAATGADLDALLRAGADHAIRRLRWFRPDAVEGRYAELEKQRLVKLGLEWLELERARAPFEVAAVEQKRAASFGGVTVNAKLDRMDRLLASERQEGSSQGHAIIDYKTGMANVGDWLGERPDDPQLPLYAVSGADEVCAVSFARVKAGELRFRGIARDEGLIPGVTTLGKLRSGAAGDTGTWEELLEGWRRELDALGREFAAGEARVDPKRGELTCRWCELTALCRISERAGGASGADGE